MRNNRAVSFGSLVLFVSVVIFIGYSLTRTETATLLGSYALLFGIYVWVLRQDIDVRFWLTGAVIARICLLFALPNLSDDFYRFIWDGRLWEGGHHPFASLPSDFLVQNISGVDTALFDKLNSKEHFTVYPPAAQFVFWLSVKISPNSILGSVMVMRLLIVAAEIGSLFIMVKLLYRFQLPFKNVLVYALNPLVILELTGNLHFEAFVIFFLLLSMWLIMSEKTVLSGISFAFAVGMKLIPLIFLPLMPAIMGWRRAMGFYIVTGICTLVIFIPMYDQQVIESFSNSLSLYFRKFEFNASLYYLVREYGFWKVGYNTIQSIGWKLSVVGGLMIVAFGALRWVDPRSTIRSGLWTGLLFINLIYLSFTTTVHPWYIIPLIAFSAMTRFRFVLLWSALVFLTYAGYSPDGFTENLVIMAFEYGAVALYLGIELFVIADSNRTD